MQKLRTLLNFANQYCEEFCMKAKKKGEKRENKKYSGEVCVEEHLVLPAVISVEGAVYV